MKRLGTWLSLVLLAALLPAAFAADAQREVSTQAQTAVEDTTAEGAAPDGPLRTEEAGLCAADPDSAATTAMGGTCKEGKGCASSSQCGGGTCFRHKCFC